MSSWDDLPLLILPAFLQRLEPGLGDLGQPLLLGTHGGVQGGKQGGANSQSSLFWLHPRESFV